MPPTLQDLDALYGPGVRYVQARDLRVGTMIVMSLNGIRNVHCTPITDIHHRAEGFVNVVCLNRFADTYHPRALVLVYKRPESHARD